MRLGSGMEAWPSSRLGDGYARGNHIGTVSHIRPTTPIPQPIKENTHVSQTEAINTIRASRGKPPERHEASRWHHYHHAMDRTESRTEEYESEDATNGEDTMGCSITACDDDPESTLWFRRVK